MFWKYLRWGGSLLVMLLVLAAIFVGTRPEDGATVQPDVPPEQPSKNFNL
ncbi:MAG: hypothetical protein V4857_10900 [Pseudomonadota bacterium]